MSNGSVASQISSMRIISTGCVEAPRTAVPDRPATLDHNRTAGSGNFDADAATFFHSGSSRRWQIDGQKRGRPAFICLLRLADLAPKQVGVEVIIQSNARNKRFRTLAFSDELGFEFWGVLTAFSIRASYAYVVHDKCPLRNKWTLS